MEIGNKILELRKKNNLSQEELAEKIGVARQTISKWELGDTCPDIKQAKELAKTFNVSIDELVNNDINNIIIEKVSNTEKLAGLVLKILKIIGITFIVILVIDVISLILFAAIKSDVSISKVEEIEMFCTIDDKDYVITVGSDGYLNCSNCSTELQFELKKNYIDFGDISTTEKNIYSYIKSKNGICEK